MKLFNNKKEVETVAFNPNAKIIVLGTCCKKATETYANVVEVASELGILSDISVTGDNMIIARYGVLQTPALVINDKVVSYGNYLNKIGRAHV